MDKQYYTVREISQFLSLKESTLYCKVESGEIPHYQIGRLIRFKLLEVEQWMQAKRKEPVDPGKKAEGLLESIRANPKLDISKIVKIAK